MRQFAQAETGQGGKGELCCFLALSLHPHAMYQWSGHQTGCKTRGCCDPAGDGHGDELHPALKVSLNTIPLPTASHGFCPWGSQNLQGVVEQGTRRFFSWCGHRVVSVRSGSSPGFSYTFVSLGANSSVDICVVARSTWAQESHHNHNLSKICRAAPSPPPTSTQLWTSASAGSVTLASEVITSNKLK